MSKPGQSGEAGLGMVYARTGPIEWGLHASYPASVAKLEKPIDASKIQ